MVFKTTNEEFDINSMEQVAYGALETPIHSDALLLQVQIDLYQTLDENPQLLQESEILEYFYQTVNLSEWAELLNALQEMEEMDDVAQMSKIKMSK